MRFQHLILALLGSMLLLVCWLLLVPAPAMPTGMAHPSIPGMSVGGDGLARMGGQEWVIFALFALTHLLMALLPVMGVQERHRSRGFWLCMGGIAAITVAVCWFMFTAYMAALTTGVVSWWLGFPTGTTLMLFFVWGSGALLSLVYIFGFRRFIYPPESERRYEALRARSGDSA